MKQGHVVSHGQHGELKELFFVVTLRCLDPLTTMFLHPTTSLSPRYNYGFRVEISSAGLDTLYFFEKKSFLLRGQRPVLALWLGPLLFLETNK